MQSGQAGEKVHRKLQALIQPCVAIQNTFSGAKNLGIFRKAVSEESLNKKYL